RTISRFSVESIPLWSCTLWLCLLLGLVLPARGQTFISGPISGTFTPSGNPYIAGVDCYVPAGETLTIQPGVILEIASNVTIAATNSLIQAVGTPSQRITIEAIGSAFWNTFSLYNASGTNRFTYCDFVNAQTAISMVEYDGNSASAEILNCTFS